MRRNTFQKNWMLLMLRKTLCLGPANENDASSHACIVNGRIPWGPAHRTPPISFWQFTLPNYNDVCNEAVLLIAFSPWPQWLQTPPMLALAS